jgi:ankyrin repeat protein
VISRGREKLAGADPKQVDESGYGVLFSSVIAKDTKLIAYLLSRGADPNLEHDLGEALYDWAEFDYRYDEYDLNLPEKPTEEVQSTPPQP